MAGELAAEEVVLKTNSPQAWREIADALRGLQFGQVTVIVQDGLVVQVERLEKRRLRKRAEKIDYLS